MKIVILILLTVFVPLSRAGARAFLQYENSAKRIYLDSMSVDECKAKIEKLPSFTMSQVDDSSIEYSTKRLAVHYDFNRRSGQLSSDKFCENYQSGIEQVQIFRQKGISVRPYLNRTHWEQAHDYGLTESDLNALRIYTLEDFQIINRALRDATPLDEAYALVKKTIDQMLEKLPNYNAAPVYRIAYLPRSISSAYEKDKVVCDKAYVSTTRREVWDWKPDIGMVKDGDEKFRFKILLNRSGRLIRDFANRPQEDEVLVRSGTCFKVLNREPMTGGEFITLQEDGDPTIP